MSDHEARHKARRETTAERNRRHLAEWGAERADPGYVRIKRAVLLDLFKRLDDRLDIIDGLDGKRVRLETALANLNRDKDRLVAEAFQQAQNAPQQDLTHKISRVRAQVERLLDIFDVAIPLLEGPLTSHQVYDLLCRFDRLRDDARQLHQELE